MNVIVNVSESWGIGLKNDLLFKNPQDMAFFVENTRGATVIMGRGTLESLPGGKPLRGRRNIVLTSRPDFNVEGVETANSLEAALELVKDEEPDRVFVIGGARIYALMLPYCSTAIVTHTHADPNCDCRFPDLSREPGWTLTEKSEDMDWNGVKFCYTRYENETPLISKQ